MAVVDGAADEVIPEQHGHLKVGLLGCHLRRHRRSERAPSEDHYLTRGLEDVAAVAATPGARPPDELLPRDPHHAAPVLPDAAWGLSLVRLGIWRRRVRGGGAYG